MDRSVAGTGRTQNRSVAGTGTASTYSKPSSTGGSTGGSGGGGGGGGGSSKDDEKKQQKKTQAQLDNTGANYQQRKNAVDKTTAGRKGDLEKIAKDRLGDMNKVAKQQLNNIKQQQEANDAALATNQRNIMQQISWQPNQQKEQSTLMALRNRMGNAAYGSGIQDLAEGMTRVDDMNDVELINAWKQNENAAYSNWYQANQSLVGDYNDQIASIEDEYSQFASDYADQMSKLNRDYQDEVSQLYSQYWSTMSNVNPELATASNMKKATQNKKAVTQAKQVQKAVSSLLKKSGGKKVSTKGLNKTQKAAAKIINAAVKDKANKNAKAVSKAAKAAAKSKVTKATSKASSNKATVGSGTDAYTLPNVDLTTQKNLSSNLNIAPSKSLSKLLVNQKNASSQDAMTKDYIRPDAARGDVLMGGENGTYSTGRAANSGFSDNLSAFRRV